LCLTKWHRRLGVIHRFKIKSIKILLTVKRVIYKMRVALE
jgi:hypothetical protein